MIPPGVLGSTRPGQSGSTGPAPTSSSGPTPLGPEYLATCLAESLSSLPMADRGGARTSDLTHISGSCANTGQIQNFLQDDLGGAGRARCGGARTISQNHL